MELSAHHLVQSEINAVTSAIRKHLRNASSSSFLGSSSSAAGLGPIAGGSSTASLLRNAVVGAAAATAASSQHAQPATNSTAVTTSAVISPTGAARASSSGKAREEVSPVTPLTSTKVNGPRQGSEGGRRDESAVSLLNGFTILRAQLRSVQDLHHISLVSLLSPFLRVILSPRTTGPVTSIALQAVHRFLIYDIVNAERSSSEIAQDGSSDIRDNEADLRLAVAEIAHAVSHCRFEASEAVADELVLLRILAVMKELICADGATSSRSSHSSLADSVGDESICEMMETGLSMCCQMRLSDLLRRTAEQSMTTMIRALFSRLAQMPLSADETYSSDPNLPEIEPEHETLVAEPVGQDAVDAEREKKLRRMTMPDPKSRDIPAAAGIALSVLQELKEMGEQEDLGEKEALVAERVDESSSKEAEESEEGHKRAGEATQSEARQAEPTGDGIDHATANTAQAEQTEHGAVDDLAVVNEAEVQPFGLPAIKEILRVIVTLLDPHNQQHTDSMRLLGLSMLCSVFEVAGQSIGRFPSLRAIIQDSACKFLFQLVRSDNTAILTYSLRTFSTLFETMRQYLKLQTELFLSLLLDRLAPTFPVSLEPWKEEAANILVMKRGNLLDQRGGRSTPEPPPTPPPPPPMPRSSDRAPAHGETREMILETLGLLLNSNEAAQRGSDRMLELWINYDCDIDCENQFEKVIHFLCRAVYANNPLHPDIPESSQIFAVDVLLNFLSTMAARQEADSMGILTETGWPADLPRADSLRSQKAVKASILDGAARFNAKPKIGLAYLEKEGFIDTSGRNGITREQSIAQFLKDCPRLDKKLLGDFISRPDNLPILDAFLRLFDFTNKPIADAMREMLETFRLPGESQQINRITETFAKIYFASQPPEIKSEDAVYVLSYSVIMLNTDLHNPQNKRRMTVEDYRRNLRGVNDNSDFHEDYLGSIYDSIRRREIVMPEEHVGQLGFEYTWKELLRKSRKAGSLLSAETTQFDKAMFEVSWRPIMAAIAQAFRMHKDEHLLEREISGFRQCAILASKFGMIELFDDMCQGLASATGLLDASGAGALTNNAHIETEGQTITVGTLSIQFGSNFKGQLAAVVLFTIANGNGNAIQRGWQPIFEIFKNLYINSLLPTSIGRMYEFGSTEVKSVPLKPKRLPGLPMQESRMQSGSGLFSTISSYLLSPYSVEKETVAPEVSEEEIESSLCTADCVASCRIEELYSQIIELSAPARLSALSALVDLANRYTVERRSNLATQSGSEPVSGRSTPVLGGSTSAIDTNMLPYDPSAAFVLEMATSIACASGPDSSAEAWAILTKHTSQILSSPQNYHSLQVERAVVSLLRLVHHCCRISSLRDQLFMALDQLTALPNDQKIHVAVQITSGLLQILENDSSFIQSQTEWNMILSLISIFSNVRNAEAAIKGYEAARVIVTSGKITTENFTGLVNIFSDFARSANTHDVSIGSRDQGQHLHQQSQSSNVRRTLTEKKEQKEFQDACQRRGPGSVEALTMMKGAIAGLSQSSTSGESGWTRYWRPLMLAIALHYTNSHRATRQMAVTGLQRILLAPEVPIVDDSSNDTSASPSSNGYVINDIFNAILLPTLDELLKPEVFQLDPSAEAGSMQETRIRACNLLCKAFLHYLQHLGVKKVGAKQTEIDDSFLRLWMQILDFFDRFMHAGKQRDQLTEATIENLKNVLLVMNASDILLPENAAEERTPSQARLYGQTFERIDKLLPNLKEELFPK